MTKEENNRLTAGTTVYYNGSGGYNTLTLGTEYKAWSIDRGSTIGIYNDRGRYYRYPFQVFSLVPCNAKVVPSTRKAEDLIKQIADTEKALAEMRATLEAVTQDKNVIASAPSLSALGLACTQMAEALGMRAGEFEVRYTENERYHKRSFFLSSHYKWSIENDATTKVLVIERDE